MATLVLAAFAHLSVPYAGLAPRRAPSTVARVDGEREKQATLPADSTPSATPSSSPSPSRRSSSSSEYSRPRSIVGTLVHVDRDWQNQLIIPVDLSVTVASRPPTLSTPTLLSSPSQTRRSRFRRSLSAGNVANILCG
ncbi:hypothetical protein DFH06DRAFT_1161940 [Mycena polygramma]|nr:hypothetical protein DFH06DRAFT_1161940 [Mycena polygramma]